MSKIVKLSYFAAFILDHESGNLNVSRKLSS